MDKTITNFEIGHTVIVYRALDDDNIGQIGKIDEICGEGIYGVKMKICGRRLYFSKDDISYHTEDPDTEVVIPLGIPLTSSHRTAITYLTLPTDSAERKNYPMLSGCLKYFPAAIAGVAKVSKYGNDKHNPGEQLHHARGKSTDHGDCIIRHLTDTEDLLAALSRGQNVTHDQILHEVNQLTWRVLAYSQELHEKFGAPLAPGAKE